MDGSEVSGGEQARSFGRSRRGLLAAAAGVLGMFGAEALARPGAARAGTDGDVVLGADNGPVTNRTAIRTANWKEFAVLADPNNDGNPYGSIGAWGHGLNYGVVGEGDPSTSAGGVLGVGSLGGNGVDAQGGLGGHGVSATSQNGIGVYGVGTGAGAYGV